MQTVVFAGGGARGLAVVGALQTLRDLTGIDFGAKLPRALKNVAGVSVGCVFAFLIAVGCNVTEISEFCSAFDTSDTINANPVILMLGGLSIDDGTLLKKFVKALFHKKGIDENITFLQLYEKTQIHLNITITNVSKNEVEHLNYESFPQESVFTAILASMSLPLIYPPIIATNGDMWIDGGVLENFPMMRYDAENLLGFDFLYKRSQNQKLDTLFAYIHKIMQIRQIPLDIVSWNLMSKQHRLKSVLIDTGTVEVIPTLPLSADQRKQLLESGSKAIREKIAQLSGFHVNQEKPTPPNMPTYLNSLKTCNP